MGAGRKVAKRIAAHSVLSRDTVCISCLHRLADQGTRRYASAAAAVAEAPTIESQDPSSPPATSTGPRKAFRLLCSPVLSRPPLLTRDLTSFEKAYYLYQKRLNERLALPFTRYFYYSKGTPGDVEWKRKARSRITAARDIGVYNAYGKDGWNDEVLSDSGLGEPEDVVDKLIKDAEGKDIVDAQPQGDVETAGMEVSGDARAGEGARKPIGDITVERPMSRTSEADQKKDLQSLSRKMDRSLYLVVRRKDGEWRFPEDRVLGKEGLHQAAERILLQAGGINMNTWVVGNHPIGHYILPFKRHVTSKIIPNRLVGGATEVEQEEYGEKVFFMKSRIMAGQADLVSNEYGDQDFQWLVKEEVQERVSLHYWAWIKNMLSER